MFARLRSFYSRLFNFKRSDIYSHETGQVLTIEAEIVHEVATQTAGHLVPYDENLLERARTQWQFGDWASLAQLNRDTLQHHPDRAKLSLLAAAGLLQIGKIDEAKIYIRLAKDWGVSKKLLTRILVAGVHNSLGRAAAIAGEHPRAVQHFDSAIATGSPESESRLITQARISQQYQQLGQSSVPTGTLPDATVTPASPSLTRHSQ